MRLHEGTGSLALWLTGVSSRTAGGGGGAPGSETGAVQPVSSGQTRSASGSTSVSLSSAAPARGTGEQEDVSGPRSASPSPPGHRHFLALLGIQRAFDRGGSRPASHGGARRGMCACRVCWPLPTPPLTWLLNSQHEHSTTI